MRNVICTQTLLLTAIVLSLAAGCGQRGNYPALGSVSGKVTLDGTPVSGAMIEFTPVSDGRPSSGETDSAGNYTLQYTSAAEGARIGEHAVKISTFRQGFEYGGAEGFEDVKGRTEEIPKKYFENPIVIEVKAGSNTIDLELTSD